MFGFRIVREKDLAQWFDQFYQAGYSQAIMSRDTYPVHNLVAQLTPIPNCLKRWEHEENK